MSFAWAALRDPHNLSIFSLLSSIAACIIFSKHARNPSRLATRSRWDRVDALTLLFFSTMTLYWRWERQNSGKKECLGSSVERTYHCVFVPFCKAQDWPMTSLQKIAVASFMGLASFAWDFEEIAFHPGMVCMKIVGLAPIIAELSVLFGVNVAGLQLSYVYVLQCFAERQIHLLHNTRRLDLQDTPAAWWTGFAALNSI